MNILNRILGDRAGRKLLKYYFKARKERWSDPVQPGSEEGRRRLEFWFNIQDYVNSQINQEAMHYYADRHPKHYMWLGHNQYIYDSIRPGERVLDIGCGASYYQQWIAEKASEVVAIDRLPERVEAARKQNTKPNLKFQVMDVTHELPPGEFDVVICSHVIEHLDDPVSLLRALAKGVPRLIVKVPLVDSGWMKLVRKDIGMFWMDTDDHRREYTIDLLREQLEEAGWEPTEIIRGFDLRGQAVSKLFHPQGQ